MLDLLIAALLGLAIGRLWPVCGQRWYAGTLRPSGRWRWLPLYLSPVFGDERHPFRTAIGFSVGIFGRAVWFARLDKA